MASRFVVGIDLGTTNWRRIRGYRGAVIRCAVNR